MSKEEQKEALIQSVKMLEPCLGGVNLEDIKSPFCFEIQSKLDEYMQIPVFHDDQYGTGIVIISGIINSLKLVKKEINSVKIVINGAGAAGIAISKLLLEFGVNKKQIYLCDSKGLITTNRANIHTSKKEFAQNSTEQDLRSTIQKSDIFIGVSRGKIVDFNMIKSMNKDGIVFAVANPVPEIFPEEALKAGAAVTGTGRGDYPNQVNNSLGFPGIFRAALDTRSKCINTKMMIAASYAISSIIGEKAEGKVKKILQKAYPDDDKNGLFNGDMNACTNYIIPRQFDLRVVPRVAAAVAKAAMETGVARIKIDNIEEYERSVFNRVINNW